MKKKLCILSNGLARGGTDTFVVNLVKGLDKTKYEITVILCIDEDEPSYREPEILAEGGTVIRTCSINKGIVSKLKHFKILYQILQKNKYDVFHTNIDLFNGPNLIIAWLAGVSIRICHSHNSRQERETNKGRTLSIRIYQRIMRKLCWKFSNRRAGCSTLALNFLFENRWQNDSNTKVINNGINLSNFQTNFDIKEKREKIGIFGKNVIITVGRLSTQKNPIMLSQIFIELCNIRDDCEMIWIGSGEMEREVKNIIERAGIQSKVHFLGTRTDVNELMQCSDVFLFPSIFEGLGIVVIEAQAAGLPCLVSDSIPKTVDCGMCEFMSIKKTPKLWANELSDIIDGEKNFQLNLATIKEYSIENMVKQMEELFY